jgi:hypothetical protein
MQFLVASAVQDVVYSLLRRAHDDRVSLPKAITRREGARPEASFREHAYRGRENKQALLQSMKRRPGDPVPLGLRLVAGL